MMKKNELKACVVQFIREYHEREGVAPTIREIALGVSGKSDNPGNMQRLLKELKRENWVDFRPYRYRTLKVIREGDYEPAN